MDKKTGKYLKTIQVAGRPIGQTVLLTAVLGEVIPLLCVEPFNGLPDVLGEPIDWEDKEGNLFLKPNSSQVYQYEMHLS